MSTINQSSPLRAYKVETNGLWSRLITNHYFGWQAITHTAQRLALLQCRHQVNLIELISVSSFWYHSCNQDTGDSN